MGFRKRIARAVTQERTSLPGWREDLRTFIEAIDEAEPDPARARERYCGVLSETLLREVVPAFEEFLGEMAEHGIAGEIFGQETGSSVTIRLHDGFEVAVERDFHRERPDMLPRLIFVQRHEGVASPVPPDERSPWDVMRKDEALSRLVDEYKRWRLLRYLALCRSVRLT